MQPKNNLTDFIEATISHWVGKNFGSQEVNEPSWNIKELSAYLSKELAKNYLKRDGIEYELTTLLPEEADTQEVETKISEYIAHNIGGMVGKIDDEGIKRLAYTINNKEKARYLYWDITLPKDGAVKLSSWLNINDNVLRYLLVQVDTRRRNN